VAQPLGHVAEAEENLPAPVFLEMEAGGGGARPVRAAQMSMKSP
jgi:hypothetical protein